MKLFQIEEPEGAPLESDGPGAAVGIELSLAKGAAVAVALGGNAELLLGSDGAPRLPLVEAASLATLLLALRERAEKALARPVTHAVVALDGCGAETRAALAAALAAAGLVPLRVVEASTTAALARTATPANAAVLGAAVQAEDDAAPLQPR